MPQLSSVSGTVPSFPLFIVTPTQTLVLGIASASKQQRLALPSHLDMTRGGSPGPACHSDLFLLGGRVVALGFSFHFPIAGERVAAWCRLDSITSVVLARFPPTQVDTRSTPQLREQRYEGCTHVTGPSPASQTCLDSASGQGPLPASPPSQLGLNHLHGRVFLHQRAAVHGDRHVLHPGVLLAPIGAQLQFRQRGTVGARPGEAQVWLPILSEWGLRLWTHPMPPPRPVHVHRAPQHLLVLGRQAPAAGLQPPVVVAHVLAHLAVLLSLLLPPGRGGAVAGWARGTKDYFSVFGDLRSYGLALQKAPNALGALPPRPVLSFPGR